MALNWNAFLHDDGLDLSRDRYPSASAGHSSDVATTTNSTSRQRQSLTIAADPADVSPFDDPTRQDTYFNDAYYGGPGDYFLSDLEVLEPFGSQIAGGSTSESSPEPATGISMGSHTLFQQPPEIEYNEQSTPTSQTIASTASSLSPVTNTLNTIPTTQTLSNSSYSSLFPDQPRAGFVEDLTFPNGPNEPAAQMPRTAATALDSLATDLTTTSTSNKETYKRPRNKPDVLSACWTSPLCPNHSDGGPPPDPATCGGGCAPFLFSSEDPLPTPTINGQLLSRDPSGQDPPEGEVEIRHKLKRSESEASSSQPTGRTFSKGQVEIQPRLKSESSGDSPENPPTQPSSEEPKGKARRRLPHNQVERKYRESLNTQLDSLRRVVPALQQNQRTNCDGQDIEDLPTPSKPSKAVILASATAYIKQMEKEKKQLQDENLLLRSRIKALQGLVKCEDCSLMRYVMDLKIHHPT